MNLFGKEPQEIAIRTLIHDTNNAIGAQKYWVKKLGDWLIEHHKSLKEKGQDINSEPYVALEYLKSDMKRLLDAIDYYLKQAENDFKE